MSRTRHHLQSLFHCKPSLSDEEPAHLARCHRVLIVSSPDDDGATIALEDSMAPLPTPGNSSVAQPPEELSSLARLHRGELAGSLGHGPAPNAVTRRTLE